MYHPSELNRELEQEAVEALEDFRQGIADQEQIRFLAWLTTVDPRLLERMNNGKHKGE